MLWTSRFLLFSFDAIGLDTNTHRGKDHFPSGVYVETAVTCPWRWRKCAAGKKNCDAKKPRFTKLCLDPDYLELSIKSSSYIRNDRQNNCTRTFRKAGYRRYISMLYRRLDKHGYLGKGRRKIAPSCVVWEVREHYPSPSGIYMGFKERSKLLLYIFYYGKLNEIRVCAKPATCITLQYYVLEL